jgi:integrase
MLNVKQTAKLTAPGLHGDGRGLYLQITPTGGKSWIYRFQLAGDRRLMGLGPLDLVTLEQARVAAVEARRLVKAGIDPVEARRGNVAARIADAAKGRTFDECAAAYLDLKAAEWRDPTNRTKWTNTLRDYASPVFGGLPVDKIGTGHITACLDPIWKAKTETASRVRQRIEAVLDFAVTRGYRSAGANPAAWKGHLENTYPKPGKRVHMEALPFAELPTFFAELTGRNDRGALALAFTILTAARSGEVLGARWSEFDLKERVWTVPGERMKAGREHRVPLSDAALALLGEPGAADERVFPLAHTAMREVLTRMGRDVTVHGFRSTFTDWCAERTAFPSDVREMALAHIVRNAVEAAYRRGDLFAKRRQLADAWTRFCSTPTAADGDNVQAIRG